MTKEFPYVNPKLVKALEEVFPLSLSTELRTLEELKVFQGKQAVIKYLQRVSENQSKNGDILNVPGK